MRLAGRGSDSTRLMKSSVERWFSASCTEAPAGLENFIARFEIGEDIGAAERVDRLLGIADDIENVAASLSERSVERFSIAGHRCPETHRPGRSENVRAAAQRAMARGRSPALAIPLRACRRSRFRCSGVYRREAYRRPAEGKYQPRALSSEHAARAASSASSRRRSFASTVLTARFEKKSSIESAKRSCKLLSRSHRPRQPPRPARRSLQER